MRLLIFVTLFFIFLLPPFANATMGIKGTVYSDVYGFQTTDPFNTKSTNQLWVFSGLRGSITGLPLKSSFVTHFQYRGNQEDKFSESGDFHLYSAYLNYGDWGSDTELKLGRFFLYRGVGLGVMDGFEYSRPLPMKLGVTLFGGMNGPDNFRAEIAKGHSPFYGGELRYSTSNLLKLQRFLIKVSYANQYRNDFEFRRSAGMVLFGRVNANWSVLSNTQIRLTSGDIRTSTLRIRYSSPKMIWYGDAGIYRPDFASYSWFRKLELPKTTDIKAPVGVAVFPYSTRFHSNFDYYFVPAKWGARIEGTAFYSGTKGYRFGVAGLTPFGQLGFQLASGRLSRSSGPWIYTSYTFYDQFKLSLNASSIDYEWEEVGIDHDQVLSANLGLSYQPNWYKSILVGIEYQHYSNPKLHSDRRVLGSIAYTFTNGGNQ